MTITDISRFMFDAAQSDSVSDTARFTVEVEAYSPTYAVLRATGDMDLTSRAELMHHLNELVRTGSDVVVDLSGVSFMYSAAASGVIEAAERADGRVQVFAPTRPVAMIFEALGASALVVDGYPSR